MPCPTSNYIAWLARWNKMRAFYRYLPCVREVTKYLRPRWIGSSFPQGIHRWLAKKKKKTAMKKYQCFSSLIRVNHPQAPREPLPYSQQPAVNYDHGFVLIKQELKFREVVCLACSHTTKAGIRTQSHLVPKFTVFFRTCYSDRGITYIGS